MHFFSKFVGLILYLLSYKNVSKMVKLKNVDLI